MNIRHRIFLFFKILCLTAFALSACAPSKASSEVLEASALVDFSFHLVRAESTSEAAMRLAEEGKVPPGAIYRPFVDQNGGLILEKRTRITARCVKSASAGLSPASQRAVVNFKFDDYCAKTFGELTAKSVGKRFAVVLNGEILTAPTINSPITSGAAFIETPSSIDAEKLARDLNAPSKNKKAK